MKLNKRILMTMIIMLGIIVAMTIPSFAAMGDGVTATVTSNPASGEEIKAGDEITYTVTIKNDSDQVYYLPTLMTQAPTSTEYVSITTTDAVEGGTVVDSSGLVTCIGTMIDARSEQVYTVKVKVAEGATGEIKYAQVTESDEETPGVVMFLLYNPNADMNEIMEIVESDAFAAAQTRDEAQALLGDRAYIGIVTQPQTLKVAEEEQQPVEPTPEQQPTEPEVNEEKPTVLPKTGMEINYIAISIAFIMIAAGMTIIVKK